MTPAPTGLEDDPAPMRGSVIAKIVLGSALALLCLPCSAVGVGMMVAPSKEGDAGSGLMLLVMALIVLGVPSGILLALGLRGRAYDRRLRHVVAVGKSSQRIPLQQLAADMKIDHDEARRLLLDAISKGELFGRLDIEQGVFISGGAHRGVQSLQMRCSGCGATSTVVVTPGSMSTCQFCGARLA